MEGYRWIPEVLQLPALNYLLVNAPDSYFGGYSWYDYAGNPEPGVVRSRQALFELLDMYRIKGFSPADTVVFGFSQGCLMAMEVGARYGHRLGGVVGVSGYVFQPEKMLKELSPVAKEQRFLVTHGTADPMIPFAASRSQYDMLQAAGMNIRWQEFPKAHTIAGQVEIDLIRGFVVESLKL